MSEWEKAGATGGHLEAAEAMPARLRSAQARNGSFPFLDLCLNALQHARQMPGLRQILVICGTGDCLEGLPQEAPGMRVDAVLAKAAGHADLLLALSMGYTQVLWQQQGEAAAGAAQKQERQAAEYLGAAGRVNLFSSRCALHRALADMAFLPLEAAPLPEDGLPLDGSRREVARACAAFLLSHTSQPIPLPETAPYGQVLVNRAACSDCQRCVWLCPTGALSAAAAASGLRFREADCIQCGMCCSACPHSALQMEPRLLLGERAETPRPLAETEDYPCRNCGAAAGPRSVVERILEMLGSGSGQMQATPAAAGLIELCGSCRRKPQAGQGGGAVEDLAWLDG